jgi:hypothetical protein
MAQTKGHLRQLEITLRRSAGATNHRFPRRHLVSSDRVNEHSNGTPVFDFGTMSDSS